MSRRLILKVGLLVASVTTSSSPIRAQESLEALLTPSLSKHQLPALAAAVVCGGDVVAVGAVGTRRAGFALPVTRDDRFHLGSNTKAMTALLVAQLVEEQALRWDMPLAEALPTFAGQMDAATRRVTVEQLLSHTSGIPADDAALNDDLIGATLQPGDLDDQRAWVVERWVRRPLKSRPGQSFAYANRNYIVLGAILERTTGRTWDELMFARIFTPLGLKTAGLGPTTALGRVDSPLGHSRVQEQLIPRLSGPSADNLLVLGPAGIAHMSILDLARWAGWNAGRGRRGPALVRPETLVKLQTPVKMLETSANSANPKRPVAGYGLGWGTLEVKWAPSPLVFHSGSNTMNLAQIWIDPARDLAIVLTTNVSGPPAETALNDLAAALYARFSKGTSPAP